MMREYRMDLKEKELTNEIIMNILPSTDLDKRRKINRIKPREDPCNMQFDGDSTWDT
jgi:hypothetical protein